MTEIYLKLSFPLYVYLEVLQCVEQSETTVTVNFEQCNEKGILVNSFSA